MKRKTDIKLTLSTEVRSHTKQAEAASQQALVKANTLIGIYSNPLHKQLKKLFWLPFSCLSRW